MEKAVALTTERLDLALPVADFPHHRLGFLFLSARLFLFGGRRPLFAGLTLPLRLFFFLRTLVLLSLVLVPLILILRVPVLALLFFALSVLRILILRVLAVPVLIVRVLPALILWILVLPVLVVPVLLLLVLRILIPLILILFVRVLKRFGDPAEEVENGLFVPGRFGAERFG